MIKLHLGCGIRRLEGYINVDIQQYDSVDLIADIANLPYEKNSVDLIYSCGVIEHFGKNNNMEFFRKTCWVDVIKHWHGLLKPNGVMYISTVDFEAVCNEYLENRNLEKWIGTTIGGQKNEEDLHGMLFDYDLFKSGLEKVGFKDIERYDWRESDMYVSNPQFDDFSRAYSEHMNFNSRLMMLNLKCRKV